jgi:hypothetical protein
MRKTKRNENGESEIVKTGKRKRKGKHALTEQRIDVPAPSWADGGVSSFWLRRGDADKMAAAAMRLYYEQRVDDNDAGIAGALKNLNGLCAGVAERSKQRKARR